jgi:putative ABC transport system permease protein
MAALIARSGTASLAEGNLTRQPTRAAITASTTLIAMAILVMAATVIASVTIGFERVLRKSLGSDYLLLPPAIAVWGNNVGAGQSLAETLRSVDGVAVVSTLRFARSRAGDLAVSVLGIDPATYPEVSGLTFTSGEEQEAYAALAEGRQVILNGLMWSTLRVKVGESIELLTPNGLRTYRVVGIATDYFNAKLATAYLSQSDLAADFGQTEDVLLQVNLDPSADRAAVELKLTEALRAYPQFRLVAGREYVEDNMAIFDAAFAGIAALGLFLAIPSLIAMVNTLAIGVIERTREIGMLRAVGATRRQVRSIVLAESLILAGIGSVLGVLAGLYLGYLGVEAMRALGYPMEYAFPAAGIWVAIAVGLGFGVVAAIVPARQAARLEIVQALRYE